MAKKYVFRFVVRKAIFNDTSVTVVFGGLDTIYCEECKELTLKEGLQHLQVISAKESRPHAASLNMKYRDDRRPPGFNNADTMIYGGKK